VVVTERLAALGHPVRLGPAEAGPWHQHRRNWAGQVFDRVAQWRGELDPANGELRAPWQPGTADRLWLCLQKMTDTATDAGRPGRSRRARRKDDGPEPDGAYQVQISITGPAAATQHLADVLADSGAAEPSSLVGPVPSREVPGAVVAYLAGSPAALPPAAGNSIIAT
jgi:hypothetical protein